MKTAAITAQRLREVLDYDAARGIFIWRRRTVRSAFARTDAAFNTRAAGTIAGTPDKKGYMIIKIDGVTYRAGRLAWLWMTGLMPPVLVDHENRDKADDRWSNLRLATHQQNSANSDKRRTNKSGHKGVSRCSATGRWKVQINENGERRYLGLYDDLGAAVAVYETAAARLFGEFAA